MQQVELVLEHYDFFCPVTGRRILGPEEFSPSPATAFVFPTQVDDFEFIREEFAKIDRKANTKKAMKDDPDGRFDRFCEGLKGYTNLVVFSITTCGVACGPVAWTTHIGIDMDHRGDQEAGE